MKLVTIRTSGVEEWVCMACGRRFLLTRQPAYSKVVLEAGNVSANHSGGKGGVGIDPADEVPDLLLPWYGMLNAY